MKKRIVRLTESDLENLVKRIIKEEDEGQGGDQGGDQSGGEETIDIKDVQNFMAMLDQYFLNKAAGKTASKRINTSLERAGLIAAMIEKFGVEMALVNKARTMLKQGGYDPKK
jgi:hypothetical protein